MLYRFIYIYIFLPLLPLAVHPTRVDSRPTKRDLTQLLVHFRRRCSAFLGGVSGSSLQWCVYLQYLQASMKNTYTVLWMLLHSLSSPLRDACLAATLPVALCAWIFDASAAARPPTLPRLYSTFSLVVSHSVKCQLKGGNVHQIVQG